MSPPSVPPQAPSSGRPLPSAGSSGASSPTSPGADSDSSPPFAPRVSFARHYHRFAPVRSPEAGRLPEGLDHFYPAPAPPHHGGEDETSQVPGRPVRTCPALRPRRTSAPRPLQDRRCRLPRSRPRRLRHAPVSGLHHAACTLSVYASPPGSPPDSATLDSGWWPALAGQGSHLLDRVDGFRHAYPSTWHPPSPGFAWRNVN